MNIAINGFGRIGRSVYRILSSSNNHKIVAINDLSDANALAYLLRHDTIMGNFDGNVSIESGNLISPNQVVKILSEPDPSKLPWDKLNVVLPLVWIPIVISQLSLKKIFLTHY